jgi:hypothetical protein
MGHVFPSQLTLSFQLSNAEPVEPEDTLLQRIMKRGEVMKFAQKLGATEEMSAVFPQDPLVDSVHILVQLRFTSEPAVISLA